MNIGKLRQRLVTADRIILPVMAGDMEFIDNSYGYDFFDTSFCISWHLLLRRTLVRSGH
jgi:hypothetical protein